MGEENKEDSRWTSRKFIVMQEIIFLAVAIPMLFAHFKIDTSITSTVLIIIGTCAGAYLGFNVLEKKVIGQ